MRISVIGWCVVAVSLGACGAVRSEPELHLVGGSVRGLWDGANGVAIRLEAEDVNSLLTVSANGTFSFDQLLERETSYTVTIAANPADHACVVDAGGTGTIAGVDVMTVEVACSGPDVSVALSGQWGWTFDPTQDQQTFAGSIMVQDVSFTVAGDSLTSASVGGTRVTIGAVTEPFALPLGVTNLPVSLAASGGLTKTYQLVFDRGGAVLEQLAYSKASNTGPGDVFGAAVALSGDTLAIGASCEASGATGINGNQADNGAPCAGAAYVFVRAGTTWTQQAYIKASNTGADDGFGTSIALSGNTLAIGAPGEDCAGIGINGGQADNTASGAGAVYVFVRNGVTWTQQAYIKASNTGANDGFGSSVALAGDTLAVAATGEDSAATGINGNQNDNTASRAGAVYAFTRSGTTWTQQAYVKASNAEAGDLFGFAVALSDTTLAVGADAEASSATGIDGEQADNRASNSGAVYVFVRTGAVWTQQAYLKASNTGGGDFFGSALALSGDTLAVGAYREASAATEIDGNQTDNGAPGAGAVYVFVRADATWSQQAYLKASNSGTDDLFGSSLALADDMLAVGAYAEDSTATGTGGNQADNTSSDAGAAYVFARTGTTWRQRTYLKASNTGASDLFGWSVALSGDTLAVGAFQEASSAAGINPPSGETDEGAASAGAVYVFR